MKVLFFLILLLILVGKTFPQQNFNAASSKYWYYRDRLRYFVMPGSEPGQSILFSRRNAMYDSWESTRYTIDMPHAKKTDSARDDRKNDYI